MLLKQLQETKKFIDKKIKTKPKIAVILGSGLSNIQNKLKDSISIPYGKIPHFKQSTVEGHNGQLVFGKLNKTDIMLMSGRLHYYEGYCMQDIIYPVRLMKFLGIETLIITCAVGALNKKYNVGDIVMIKDHINFLGNPLIGKHYSIFGNRFPDSSNIYDQTLRKTVKQISIKNKIKIHEGIYFAVTGPSYETPSEVKAFIKLGGDVVGMSLVPESITASQEGIKTVALTYVSNKATGISKKQLSHSEVLALGKKASISLEKTISELTVKLK